MGWSSGSTLMTDCIRTLQKHIPDEALRQKIYVDLIHHFAEQDWDCPEDCTGYDNAFDLAYEELYPDEGEVDERDPE